MAAKKTAYYQKTIYLNKKGRIREIKQADADIMKLAFQKMFKDYLAMKKQQRKFEKSLGELCMIIHPWTIPGPWVRTNMTELGQPFKITNFTRG